MMENAIGGLLWSAWGFGIGWSTCVVVTARRTAMPEARRRDRAVAVILILLAVFVTVQSVYFSRSNAAQDACFRDTLSARASISREDFEAAQDAIAGLADSDTKAERQAVSDHYAEVRRELEAQRAENPYPTGSKPCV